MSIARNLAVSAFLLAPLASAAVAVPGPSMVRQDPQDDEDAAYQEAVVRRSLEENCLICHTDDMIAGQRLTPAQWKAEVDKMIGWGSPLPKEAAPPLVEYLVRHYSDRVAPPVPARSPLKQVESYEVPVERAAAVTVSGDPARGERLYAANCATCHGPTALGGDLGPSLVHKAILDHPADFNRITMQGLHRMPGFRTTMKEVDQADMLAWLRHLSYPSPIQTAGR